MATPHPTPIIRNLIRPARLVFNDGVRYAVNDFDFTQATQSGSFGLREPAVMTITPNTNPDFAQRDIPNTAGVEIKMQSFQATLTAWRNAYLLSREPHKLYCKTEDGKYYTFIANTADPGDTPNGTSLVGLGWEYMLTKDKNTLDLTWNTVLSLAEYDYLLNNQSAPGAGTGGTSMAQLTSQGYDRSQQTVGNVAYIKIENSGGGDIDIGSFNEPSIKISSTDLKDQYDRQIGNRKAAVDITFNALDNDVTSILAWLTDMQEDLVSLSFYLKNGYLIRFNDGAASLMNKLEVGDTNRYNQISVKGEIPYNVNEATPNAIDIGVTDAATVDFYLI